MAAHYGFPDQMQQDIDELGANETTAADGGPILPPPIAEGGGVNATGSGGAPASSPGPPPGMYPLDPAAMQNMMQGMMQQMMQVMMSFQQSGQGAAASGTSPLAASSPPGGDPLEARHANGERPT